MSLLARLLPPVVVNAEVPGQQCPMGRRCRQAVRGRRQAEKGRRQAVKGRRQAVKGRRQAVKGRRPVVKGTRQYILFLQGQQCISGEPFTRQTAR